MIANQMTVVGISLCLWGLLMLEPLNLYPYSSLRNLPLQALENDKSKTNDDLKTLTASNSSANTSGKTPESRGVEFTISCSDFKKLFDALMALNIDNEVAKGSVNQSTLDDVENIFNTYAGNCSQLDEYEFG